MAPAVETLGTSTHAREVARATPSSGREVPPHPAIEGSKDAPEEAFLAVLDTALNALARSGVPFAALGGLASSVMGRHRWTHDIDLFVRPEDADAALDALQSAGFTVQRLNSHWIYKAMLDDVVVDVIFRAKGDLTYDDDMIERTWVADFKGRPLPVLAPEDLVVIKAIVHDEETPRHWFDALGVLKSATLDWDYLEHRARVSPRRVLSLLLYALSADHVVPTRVLRNLFDTVSDEHGQ